MPRYDIVKIKTKCPYCDTVRMNNVQTRSIAPDLKSVIERVWYYLEYEYPATYKVNSHMGTSGWIVGLTKCVCGKIFTVNILVDNELITNVCISSKDNEIMSVIDKIAHRIETVIDMTCDLYGIQPKALTVKCKKKEPSYARYIIWSLIREIYPEVCLRQLGELFNRDHATALHGLKQIQIAKNNGNPELLHAYNRVKNEMC